MADPKHEEPSPPATAEAGRAEAALAAWHEVYHGLSEEEIAAVEAIALNRQRIPGSARGLIQMSEDFDEPIEDFAEYM